MAQEALGRLVMDRQCFLGYFGCFDSKLATETSLAPASANNTFLETD